MPQPMPPFMSQAPRPQRLPPSSSPPHGSCGHADASPAGHDVDVPVEDQRTPAARAGQPADDVVASGQRLEAVDLQAERRELGGNRILAGRLRRGRPRLRAGLRQQLGILTRMRDERAHERNQLVPVVAHGGPHGGDLGHGRRS